MSSAGQSKRPSDALCNALALCECLCCVLPGPKASESEQQLGVWFYAEFYLLRCATYWDRTKIPICVCLQPAESISTSSSVQEVVNFDVKTDFEFEPLAKLDTRFFGELLAEVYRKNCDIHTCISEHVSKIRGRYEQNFLTLLKDSFRFDSCPLHCFLSLLLFIYLFIKFFYLFNSDRYLCKLTHLIRKGKVHLSCFPKKPDHLQDLSFASFSPPATSNEPTDSIID